ncbi:hypothetical protein EJ110_NYTH39737 [Nymphaea thermarum]|nr:hypothetical protein EJ110_NYTH39737 [Nymphaea thermarum]
MDIFLSTYNNGECVQRDWLVHGNQWDHGPRIITLIAGSSPCGDIIIQHPSVLYWHFRLLVDKDTWEVWISNYEGKLVVNGSQLGPYKRRIISPGDVIQVGRSSPKMVLETIPNMEVMMQRMTAIIDRRIESIQRRSLSNAVITPPESEPESEGDNENDEESSSKSTGSEEDSTSTMEVEEDSTDEECVVKDIPHNVSSEESTSRIQSMVPPPRRTGIASVYRRFFSTPSRGRPERVASSNDQEGSLPMPNDPKSPESWTTQSILGEVNRICHDSESDEEQWSNELSSVPTLGILPTLVEPYEPEPLEHIHPEDKVELIRHRLHEELNFDNEEPCEREILYGIGPHSLETPMGRKLAQGITSHHRERVPFPSKTMNNFSSKEGGTNHFKSFPSEARLDLQNNATLELVGQASNPDSTRALNKEWTTYARKRRNPTTSALRAVTPNFFSTRKTRASKAREEQKSMDSCGTTSLWYQRQLQSKEGGLNQWPNFNPLSMSQPGSALTNGPNTSSAAEAQWVKLQKDEALGVVELEPPLSVKRLWPAHGGARPQEESAERAKQLLEQHRAMIGQLPRDNGPRPLQGVSEEPACIPSQTITQVYSRGPRKHFSYLRNSLETLSCDYGPQPDWVDDSQGIHQGENMERAWGQAQTKEGGSVTGQNPTPQRPDGSPAEGPCASIANGVGCKWANRLPPCKPTVSRHCEVKGGGSLGPTWEDPSSLGYMAAVGGVGGAANVKKKETSLNRAPRRA